jgi:hypothetical protein
MAFLTRRKANVEMTEAQKEINQRLDKWDRDMREVARKILKEEFDKWVSEKG